MQTEPREILTSHHLRVIVLLAFLLFARAATSQPACSASACTLQVIPTISSFCIGDDINFKIAVTSPTTVSGNITWSYSGSSASSASSGLNKRIFDLTGTSTSGLITATG